MHTSAYFTERFGEMVLASSSPRRAQILRQIGFRFIIRPSHIEEIFSGGNPVDEAKVIAERKAEEISRQFPDRIVLAADTIVVIDNRVLNKPTDAADAVRMLQMLSNRTHLVHTAFTICHVSRGKRLTDVETTEVTFKALSDEWIRRYVDGGSPMDKAGSYGIQDESAIFVRSIKGDFYNVVGLPISRITDDLEKNF